MKKTTKKLSINKETVSAFTVIAESEVLKNIQGGNVNGAEIFNTICVSDWIKWTCNTAEAVN